MATVGTDTVTAKFVSPGTAVSPTDAGGVRYTISQKNGKSQKNCEVY